MRYFIIAVTAALALSATSAHARCSNEEGERALKKFYAWVEENPDKKDEAIKAINQVKSEMGGQIQYEQVCDVVSQILSRLGDHGR